MSATNTPRNLLLGILALQMQFIKRDVLGRALKDLGSHEDQSLGEILVRNESLTTRHCDLLEQLVDAHVEAHAGDPEQSFAALSSIDALPEDFDQLTATVGIALLTRQSIATPAAGLDDTTIGYVPELSKGASKSVGEQSSLGNRFRILRPHAEGGLGKVSLALDDELHREVVLKEIKDVYVHDELVRSRFTLEAEITGGLEHPGVVPVYGLGSRDDGRPFYAMRFIRGESLKDACTKYHRQKSAHSDSENALEFRKLLGRFIDVCQAIEYAHSRGVLHRDLKPGNIMLGKFGETLVVDWGLAKNIGRDEQRASVDEAPLDPNAAGSSPETKMGSALGTPHFMSPEQAAGKLDELGPASDVYSLGATLYYLLTNRSPLKGHKIDVALAKVQQGEFPSPSEIDPKIGKSMEAICLKAMALEPTERYDSAIDLANDVERWLADEPVTACREPLSIRCRRLVKQHRVLFASTIVALLVALISLGVILGIQTNANHQLRIANENERDAKQQAEAEFEIALRAMRQYHDSVTRNFLLGQSEFADLRASLLESPKAFYSELAERLAKREQPSRMQLESLADAYKDLGSLQAELNEREQAINSYQNAVKVIDRLLVRRNDDVDYLKDKAAFQVRMGRHRRALGQISEATKAFDSAQTIVDALLQESDHRPDFLEVKANLLGDRGLLFESTGEPSKSIESLQDAVRLGRRILQIDTSNRQYRADLASNLNQLALLFSGQGEIEKSEAAFVESQSLSQALLEEDPGNAFAVFRLAGTLTNLAYLWQANERYGEAKTAYELAVPQFRRLVDEAPNIITFQSGLASALNNLGLMHQSLKQFDDADACYREALEIKERLATNYPAAFGLRVSLGGGYSNYGGFVLQQNDENVALPWFDRAVEVLDEVLIDQPDESSARYFLRQTHSNRALILRRLERFDEAAEAYRLAIQYNVDPAAIPSLLRRLGHTLIRAGDHPAVTRVTQQLSELATTDQEYYDIVVLHALSIGVVQEDDSLEKEQAMTRIRELTRLAVDSLRAMFETNLVARDVFEDLLQTNTFLDNLRDQAEFKQYLEGFLSN